jgi:parvulin-like peptidyl-prolyl isomerase
MMQTFRNNMKIVFFILIFFFVGWMGITLTGLDDFLLQQSHAEIKGLKYAGTVDGKSIDRAVYDQRVQRTVDMATNQRGGVGLSVWEIDQLAEQVWTEMVSEIVFSKVYDKHRIDVSNAEVVEYIKSNPLPELMRMPELQTDGRFDYDKYYSMLSDPRATSFVFELERDAREKIPSFKLFLEIASLNKLTDTELLRAYKEMEERVKVRYIHLAPDSLVPDSEVEIGEQEVKEYYQSHLDDFKRPDMADLSYILIPLTPGSADSAAAVDTLEKIMKKLDEGEDWDSLATSYSQGPLASSGGNLGWFARGDYTDKKMVDLAFRLRVGRISKPTLTEAGYQILRLDSIRTREGKREVKARRILRKIEPGRRRISQIRSKARALRKLMRVSDSAFVKVAADSGFTVTRTGLFAIGGRIPGIETSRELLDYVYGTKVGNISYPIVVYAQGEDLKEAILLARVEEQKERGTIALDEATSTIRRHLIIEKKKEKAKDIISKLIADYENFENLEAFAQARNLKLETSSDFTRLTGLAEVGRNNAFIGTAFGLPVGAKSGLIEAGNDYYLLEVVSRSEADTEKFEQNREQLVEQIRNSRMQALYSLFTTELINNTEIEDLRKIPPPDTPSQSNGS